jgi:ribose transport system substrate-binding protein
MKLKEVVRNILVIASAFLLFIVWYESNFGNSMQTQTTASLAEFYKIYLITPDKDRQIFKDINQGASDMAKAIGVNYIWETPAVRSAKEQIQVIRKSVNDGVNALIIVADDAKRISGAVEDAKARGVKIIYVDQPAFEEAITTLSTDDYAAGLLEGETMLSELGKQGIQNGSIGIITVKDKPNYTLRVEGIRKAMEKNANFTILDIAFADDNVTSSEETANRLISENKDLVGLIGVSESMSEGIGNAIKADNNRIIGVGFDISDKLLQLYNEGSLKALMVQNSYTMGYLGMAEAVAAIMGHDTGPNYFDTGISVLRSE